MANMNPLNKHAAAILLIIAILWLTLKEDAKVQEDQAGPSQAKGGQNNLAPSGTNWDILFPTVFQPPGYVPPVVVTPTPEQIILADNDAPGRPRPVVPPQIGLTRQPWPGAARPQRQPWPGALGKLQDVIFFWEDRPGRQRPEPPALLPQEGPECTKLRGMGSCGEGWADFCFENGATHGGNEFCCTVSQRLC
jgi:hypothetical protein